MSEQSKEEEKEKKESGRPSYGAAPLATCPFMDTLDRATLDFDFEKCCSVTLSTQRVYGCLVCGRYFQGRVWLTPAHAHALEVGYHVFIRLEDGIVFCLPDG